MKGATRAVIAVLLLGSAVYYFLPPDSLNTAPVVAVEQERLAPVSEPAQGEPATPRQHPDATLAESSGNDIADPFAVRSWEPSRPPTLPPPPPPPQAPPLPFRFIGKISDREAETAFMLRYGEQVLVVRVGDEVDSTYRVDNFRNGQLEFEYLPLQTKQLLFVGSDS